MEARRTSKALAPWLIMRTTQSNHILGYLGRGETLTARMLHQRIYTNTECFDDVDYKSS